MSTQSRPPFVGGGLLHCRFLIRTPPSIPPPLQVCEHEDQLLQPPHAPSNGAKLKTWCIYNCIAANNKYS